MEQEVVVLQPVGQHVVRYDPPPALPHLIGSQRKDSRNNIFRFKVIFRLKEITREMTK